MNITHTERDFEVVSFNDRCGTSCSLQQSSAIDTDQPNALGRPGGTCIWLGVRGFRMHLGYDQVAELTKHLQAWMETGSFEVAEAGDGRE